MKTQTTGLVPPDLDKAIETMDRQAIRKATEAFIAELRRTSKGGTRKGEAVLDELRSVREFALMEQVGDCLIQSGRDSLTIRRLYAQSLIDQGRLSAAITLLEQIAAQSRGKQPAEYREAMGLLGRAYKQIYMDTDEGCPAWKKRALRKSIEHYHQIYAQDRRCYWHGINTAALLRRAGRDGVTIEGFPSETTLALEILQCLTRKKSPTSWEHAAAAEACIALDRHEEALRWLRDYLDDPGLTAFHLASFLRQLTQVWGLTADHPPGSAIIPLLSHQLLHRDGGTLPLSAKETRAALGSGTQNDDLEKVFGVTAMRSCNWWRKGLERARTVAKICLKDEKDGVGTGFLMKASELGLPGKDDNDQVLVTNAHVVSDRLDDALDPEDVHVHFELLDGDDGELFEVEKLLHSVADLDVSLLRLDRKVAGIEPAPWTDRLPRPNRSRVYVIGHPRGGGLAFSIQDNHLIAARPPLLHYRAPTEPGSSGSPVFNENWKLIAVHHAGSERMRRIDGKAGYYPANEGICFASIKEALVNRSHDH